VESLEEPKDSQDSQQVLAHIISIHAVPKIFSLNSLVLILDSALEVVEVMVVMMISDMEAVTASPSPLVEVGWEEVHEKIDR